MMPSHTPSAAELREIRARARRKLAAAVPLAIKILTERKTKLEARIDAGKTLSPRHRRELEKIRALLDQHHNQQILIRALLILNSMGLENIHAMVRQVAAARADEEAASNSGSGHPRHGAPGGSRQSR
jgi:uncharacterized membrane protein YgcG